MAEIDYIRCVTRKINFLDLFPVSPQDHPESSMTNSPPILGLAHQEPQRIRTSNQTTQCYLYPVSCSSICKKYLTRLLLSHLNGKSKENVSERKLYTPPIDM